MAFQLLHLTSLIEQAQFLACYNNRNKKSLLWLLYLVDLVFSLIFVSVCFGFYNKIPETRWLINTKHLFLEFWRLGSQDQGTADLVCGEKQPPGTWMAVFSLCLHAGEGTRDLSGDSLIRTLILFMRASPSKASHLPKAPPPTATTLGIRI